MSPNDIDIESQDFIQQLATGVASLVGEAFFSSLVRFLGETLKVKYAFIGKVDAPSDAKSIQTLAVYAGGKDAPNLNYALADTPCEDVIRKAPCIYPDKVQEAFPHDMLLAELGAQSYVGAPLVDVNGFPLGVLVVLHDAPLTRAEQAQSILQIFAARAAAELERLRTEQALRRSEASLAEAQQVANIGSWEWDPTTKKMWWSDQLYRLYGYDPQTFEPTIEKYFSHVVPDDREIIRCVETKIGDPSWQLQGFEYRILRADGELRHVFDKARVICDEEGRVQRLVGAVQDITERKRTADSLSRTKNQLQALYDAIPDMIFVHANDGRIIDVNDNVLHAYGMTREEVLNTPFEDLCGEGYSWPMAKAHIEEALDTGRADFEWRTKKKNGTEFPVEVRLRRLSATSIVRERGLIAVARDITARKRVDEVIAMLARAAGEVSLEQFLQDCVRQLTHVYQARYAFVGRLVEPARTHVQTLAVWASDAPVENFVYALEGTPCQDVLDLNLELVPRSAQQSYPDDAMLVDMGVESYFGSPLISVDGKMLGLVAVLDVEPMELEPWVRPVLGVFATRLANEIERAEALDALQRSREQLEGRVVERTAELQAVNRELETFAYSVSHDLRAPLRAIDGFSKALEEDYVQDLDESAHALIERVRNGAQRMGHLIDALLKLSRISRVEIKRQTIDMGAIATEVAAGLREVEPERDVKFELAANVGDFVVQADPVLLRAVLENLLGNAFKYTRGRDNSRIGLSVEIKENEPVFCVFDNGIGFDMAHADKLFIAFKRLHSGSAAAEGLGIGLATVQRIINRHGGLIWAESAADQGARFYFTLNQRTSGRRWRGVAA